MSSEKKSRSFDTPIQNSSVFVQLSKPDTFRLHILPWIELLRLNRAGFFYPLLPHLYGVILAGIILKSSPLHILRTSLFLSIATMWLTVTVNAWDDLLDERYDRLVERTKNRPIPRGAISKRAAFTFTLVSASITGGFLIVLPTSCSLYAVPMATCAAIYPLIKRVTHFVQIYYSVLIGSGVMMGASSAGLHPFLRQEPSSIFDVFTNSTYFGLNGCEVPVTMLYFANALWGLVFETIYSFQDVWDDRYAGVMSMNLLLIKGNRAKAMLTCLATAKVVLLYCTGVAISASKGFYLSTVGLTSATLAQQIYEVDLFDPASCKLWFGRGEILTGISMLGGLLVEFLM